MTAKAQELYKKVIALDPEGKAGSYTYEYLKATVPYTRGRRIHAGSEGRVQPQARSRRRSGLSSRSTRRAGSSRTPIATSAIITARRPPRRTRTSSSRSTRPSSPRTRRLSAPIVRAHHQGQGPARQGPRHGRKAQGHRRLSAESGDYQENLAQLYVLKNDPAKVDEEYGKDFADGYASNAVLRPDRLRQFLDRSRQEPRERRGDGRPRRRPPSGQQRRPVLHVRPGGRHLRQAQEDGQGPGLLRPRIRQEELGRPVRAFELRRRFWNRQGTNLESALAAARRSVELSSGISTTISFSARSCSR